VDGQRGGVRRAVRLPVGRNAVVDRPDQEGGHDRGDRPAFGLMTINALCACDQVLIPMQCEFYALEGLSNLIQSIKRIKHNLNPKLNIAGILLTMFDRRNNLSDLVESDVRAYFGDQVFDITVPRNVRISEASSHGKPVILYDPRSKGASAYIALAREFLTREGRLYHGQAIYN
ncbi:MAG: ParA family protein, partial [Pseudomonadota bacterium]